MKMKMSNCRCWGDHWEAATGEEMDLNPHIPKPEPPPEPEKEEEKKEEEKKEGEEKKEEQATTEKEEKKEEEKEKADEKKEGDEKKVIRPPFKAFNFPTNTKANTITNTNITSVLHISKTFHFSCNQGRGKGEREG